MSEFEIRLRENRRTQEKMWRDAFDFVGGVMQVGFGFLVFYILLVFAGLAA